MVKDVRRAEIDAANIGEMRSLSSQLGEGVNVIVAKVRSLRALAQTLLPVRSRGKAASPARAGDGVCGRLLRVQGAVRG